MATNKRCPEIHKAGEEETTLLRTHFKALENYPGFIRVGEAGYLFPVLFKPEIEKVYNVEVRPSDVYVATFPRSGTTWVQEMVWLILNDLDYAKAATLNLVERYVQLGTGIWGFSDRRDHIVAFGVSGEDLKKYELTTGPGSEQMLKTPDPRFIKTHLPFCMLPPNLIDTAKVVYVARDPRDVAVSKYHISRLYRVPQYTGDFKTFWKIFRHDNLFRSPYFPHVKEAWDLRNHPNMLFLFYEELKKDLPGVIKRTTKFFNKEYTDEQILGLCNHLDIDNFRNNDSVGLSFLHPKSMVSGEQPFIRKGKVGGWRDYFDDEMTKEAELWLAKNLEETGIQFPISKD